MRIGIDLDNTITQYPAFFRLLTHALSAPHEIHIITSRDPECRAETAAELAELGIRYDALAITDDKVSYVRSHGIEAIFEDTDEFFLGLPEAVAVFKVREPGNFDFDSQRWIYSRRTGQTIDEWISQRKGTPL